MVTNSPWIPAQKHTGMTAWRLSFMLFSHEHCKDILSFALRCSIFAWLNLTSEFPKILGQFGLPWFIPLHQEHLRIFFF